MAGLELATKNKNGVRTKLAAKPGLWGRRRPVRAPALVRCLWSAKVAV